MSQRPRSGILAGGTFVLDHVKVIDAWPQQDMLANIVSEQNSNGGGPYNVLKNLAAMGAEFPLAAAGLLGNDANAQWILSDCAADRIDVGQLNITDEEVTSYTDAMCVESDGRRTFFHRRGANALLAPTNIDLAASNAKIFYLGYLLILDTMDRLDSDGRTQASFLLEQARSTGFLTAVETASASDPRFREVVIASLQHADFLLLNETEASMVLGEVVGSTGAELRSATTRIAALGAPGRVIVHCVQGAVCREPDGTLVSQPSIELPCDLIKGSTGAGDAFTAGYLHGAHDDATTQTSLLQGVCAAAQSLTQPTASGGMKPLRECMSLANRFGLRDF